MTLLGVEKKVNFENESLLFLLLVWLDTVFGILVFFFSTFGSPIAFVWSFRSSPPTPTLAIWSGFRLLPAHCLTEGMKSKKQGNGSFSCRFPLQIPGSPLPYVRVKEFQI